LKREKKEEIDDEAVWEKVRKIHHKELTATPPLSTLPIEEIGEAMATRARATKSKN